MDKEDKHQPVKSTGRKKLPTAPRTKPISKSPTTPHNKPDSKPAAPPRSKSGSKPPKPNAVVKGRRKKVADDCSLHPPIKTIKSEKQNTDDAKGKRLKLTTKSKEKCIPKENDCARVIPVPHSEGSESNGKNQTKQPCVDGEKALGSNGFNSISNIDDEMMSNDSDMEMSDCENGPIQPTYHIDSEKPTFRPREIWENKEDFCALKHESQVLAIVSPLQYILPEHKTVAVLHWIGSNIDRLSPFVEMLHGHYPFSYYADTNIGYTKLYSRYVAGLPNFLPKNKDITTEPTRSSDKLYELFIYKETKQQRRRMHPEVRVITFNLLKEDTKAEVHYEPIAIKDQLGCFNCVVCNNKLYCVEQRNDRSYLGVYSSDGSTGFNRTADIELRDSVTKGILFFSNQYVVVFDIRARLQYVDLDTDTVYVAGLSPFEGKEELVVRIPDHGMNCTIMKESKPHHDTAQNIVKIEMEDLKVGYCNHESYELYLYYMEAAVELKYDFITDDWSVRYDKNWTGFVYVFGYSGSRFGVYKLTRNDEIVRYGTRSHRPFGPLGYEEGPFDVGVPWTSDSKIKFSEVGFSGKPEECVYVKVDSKPNVYFRFASEKWTEIRCKPRKKLDDDSFVLNHIVPYWWTSPPPLFQPSTVKEDVLPEESVTVKAESEDDRMKTEDIHGDIRTGVELQKKDSENGEKQDDNEKR